MYQIQKQTTHSQITAHLAQTMTLLTKTVEELNATIEGELASNPALEMSEEIHCPMCNRILPSSGFCPSCAKPKTMSSNETVVFISPRTDFINRSENDLENDVDEQTSIAMEDLPANVLRQIAPDLEIEDRQIAAYLLNQLTEDGLLEIDLEELANYFHVPIERIKNVQKLIQHADPIGVGSSSPQAAILIQLEVLSDSMIIPDKASKIIENEFDLLIKRQYKELAKKMDLSDAGIKKAVDFIKNNLNPYPARAHWGNERQPDSFEKQVYHSPDVLINHLNNDSKNPLMVEVILPIRGTLQLNPVYKQAIKQSEGDAREDLKKGMEKASLFIKCIQQRNNTMQRLMERIVAYQRKYILSGERYIRPITRAELSRELGVHESTISRAVSNKSVKLPNGQIVPLSKFFERSLNVRAVIREIVSKESRPLSDSKIVSLLDKKGIHIARRTVAKYRSMEGILPTHLRKKTNK
jgi:RNA polymerase sigma-54 factor